MKFDATCEAIIAKLSLPVRGAWIEILRVVGQSAKVVSLPVRGAWIEIFWTTPTLTPAPCRSPCGERGLKYFGQRQR